METARWKRGRIQKGGDRPPETYESNFIHHKFVLIRRTQHSRYKATLSSIVLSQQCCEAYFVSLAVVKLLVRLDYRLLLKSPPPNLTGWICPWLEETHWATKIETTLESESADLLPSSGPVACVRNFTEAFVQTCKETSPNRRLDQAGQEGPAGVILNNKFHRDGKKKKNNVKRTNMTTAHTHSSTLLHRDARKDGDRLREIHSDAMKKRTNNDITGRCTEVAPRSGMNVVDSWRAFAFAFNNDFWKKGAFVAFLVATEPLQTIPHFRGREETQLYDFINLSTTSRFN